MPDCAGEAFSIVALAIAVNLTPPAGVRQPRVSPVAPAGGVFSQSTPVALDGIILDLDGTLVDTNALHVEAWRRVLESHGYRVAPARIFMEIGKGGDFLVPHL